MNDTRAIPCVMDWGPWIQGLVITIIAPMVVRPGYWVVRGIFENVFGDVPQIGGTWRAEYVDTDRDGAERIQCREELVLRQLGRLVWGTGMANATADTEGSRTFRYRGELRRNVLFARYNREKGHGPGGSGAMQLRVTRDDDKMVGWCMWFDRHSNVVEASKYEATRVGSA